MQIMLFTALKSIKVALKYAKMNKSKKDVKTRTKNNNTSSHMLLD